MRKLTTLVTGAVTAALVLGTAVTPASAASYPVKKRNHTVYASQFVNTGEPITVAPTFTVRRNGTDIAWNRGSYKAKKKGKYTIRYTYAYRTTQQGQVPVTWISLAECRVETEYVRATRITWVDYGDGYYTDWYGRGQVDMQYSGTCRGHAYDKDGNYTPVTWQDQWLRTEYLDADYIGGTLNDWVLANNDQAIGDVDFTVWEGELKAKPTTMQGWVDGQIWVSGKYRFRIK
jgi:hypothetical protein